MENALRQIAEWITKLHGPTSATVCVIRGGQKHSACYSQKGWIKEEDVEAFMLAIMKDLVFAVPNYAATSLSVLKLKHYIRPIELAFKMGGSEVCRITYNTQQREYRISGDFAGIRLSGSYGIDLKAAIAAAIILCGTPSLQDKSFEFYFANLCIFKWSKIREVTADDLLTHVAWAQRQQDEERNSHREDALPYLKGGLVEKPRTFTGTCSFEFLPNTKGPDGDLAKGGPVNHPKHYNANPSGVEAITVIEHMSFNVGNAVKYLWRAGSKDPNALQDLKKAAWYVNREIERLSKCK